MNHPNDTRRYRRLRRLLRETWGAREPYALTPRTEDALVRLLVRIELDSARIERRRRGRKECDA
jgi:hypothetical protein